MQMPTERARAYVYRCLLAAAPLAVLYGVASGEQVALWLTVAASVLGVGLAAANTTTARPDQRGAGELKMVALVALGVILAVAFVVPLLERTF